MNDVERLELKALFATPGFSFRQWLDNQPRRAFTRVSCSGDLSTKMGTPENCWHCFAWQHRRTV